MSFVRFNETRVRAVIRNFGQARNFSVYVGAGVSVEAGLPTWERLTERLLKRAASESGAFTDDEAGNAQERWVRRTLQSSSLTTAASVAEALLNESLPQVLREELFRSEEDDRRTEPSDYSPGPIATELARLRGIVPDRSSHRMRILTTNYDNLLIQALRREPQLAGFEPFPVCSPDVRDPQNKPPLKVRHLHGFIDNAQTLGEIVLTEDSFLKRDTSRRDWRQREVDEALSLGPCLFVGTSLNDFNVTRHLYEGRAKGGPHHAVVFVRQAEQGEEPDEIRKTREATATKRWAGKKLDVIFFDHYADVAQLIHEIALRKQFGTRHWHVDQRGRKFVDVAERKVICQDNTNEFRQRQEGLNDALCRARESLIGVMAERGVDLSGERLSLGLWLLDREGGSMTAWGATDRVHTDPVGLQSVSLDPESRWVAVQALCRGSRVEEIRDYRDTRWSYIIGLPLFAKFRGRVLVGAVTVASADPVGTSQLVALSKEDHKVLEQEVTGWVCDWFESQAGPELRVASTR